MDKFKEFTQKYSLKELSGLILITILLFIITYAKSDSFIIDIGREAVLPWQMLEGKVLFKDLFNVYGAVSYQINALAFMIFGTKLSTLYFLGLFSSILIVSSMFYITKYFTNNAIAFFLALLMLPTCVFGKVLHNFSFPYAYAAVYALAGYFLSAGAFLAFIKERKSLFLCLAFLFAGFSFGNKIEHVPYFALLFVILPFLRINLKSKLAAAVSFFVIPVISTFVLILQGAGINNLLEAGKLAHNLAQTPSFQNLYVRYGLYYNNFFVKFSIIDFLKLFAVLLPLSAVLYGLNYLKAKTGQKMLFYSFYTGFIVIFCAVIFNMFKAQQPVIFDWLGITCIAIFAGFCVFLGRKIYQKKEIKTEDIMYIFLLASAIAVSVKGIASIQLECYGTFPAAALSVPFVIFCSNYLCKISKKIDKNIWNAVLATILAIFSILYFTDLFIKHTIFHRYPVTTQRGTIYVKKELRYMQELVNYIEKNTPEDAQILSVPESSIINFLTERPTHEKYYYLIPPNVELFGEENILNDLKNEPPNYFLLNTMPYVCFNVADFCSYAGKICDFINEEYTPVFYLDGKVKYFLFKKKTH